jgi:hypothetical protein
MLKRKRSDNQASQRPASQKAQSAIEYMLLFATVMVVVMYSFDTYFPFVRESSNLYYNRVVIGITGKEPPDFCHVNHGGTVGCLGY